MKVTGILGGGLGQGAGTGPQGFIDNSDVEETPNVTDDEQRSYDEFVKNGMEIMYRPDGTVEPEILKRLSTGNKPIDTMAQTTVWLAMMLEQDAKKAGHEIADEVIFHAGRELMEQLVDIADAADIHKFKQAEIQGAWYNALDMYREANTGEGGRINPDEAAAGFEALNEADKEGRADEILPGFYQQSERAITDAMNDQNPTQEEDAEGGDEKILNRKVTGNA